MTAIRRPIRHGALLLSIGGALAIAGCGGDEPRYDYPEEAQDNFLTACGAGASEEQCECLLDEYQDTLSFDDFARIDMAIARSGTEALGPTDADRFQSAIDACS